MYHFSKNWWSALYCNITNAPIIGISETKVDEPTFSSELPVGSYDLIRINWSRRDSGVACYIKVSIAYSYKGSLSSNIESIFIDIYLPKPKPVVLGILCRSPDESDFVKHINNVFTETGVLEKQELELNANLLLDEIEIFSNKSYRTNGQHLAPQRTISLILLFSGTTNSGTY